MAIPVPLPLGGDPFGSMYESISELTERIKDTLEADFAEVAAHGELTNLARPKSGHIYFSLRDAGASVRGVMWKSDAQRLAFDLEDGLAVRVLGRLTVYPPRGDYQVVVRQLEPEGIGALELAFRQLFARLAAEGLFDVERKRPLPRFPRRIVVVTSPTGAAVRDLLQVTGRRWPATEILIAPARVQGVGAGAEIAAAIATANAVAAADLIIVARGGGSAEDLRAFNEEVVARAIAGSRLPVVSAVGHEVDVTLADLAADRRALTPSEAGEISVPDGREIAMHLDRLAGRIHQVSRLRIQEARAILDGIAARAKSAIRRNLDDHRHHLERAAASLEALSPLGVLARGYSLTFREDGMTLVRSPGDVRPGDLILTRLGTGEVASRVVEGPSGVPSS
ncbi:Exodeoxyribonuclease 7 large subunit [Aquisphaera giovannonii]|uniref:Exodeoxyribonuclease 7 large subunit n=1 Tax=Aquisphaera giovannonii TaxID=406548 RepID=A0A5B9WAV2_9BACT|nr:exodeoxyribonuclease VII large subunit [Aquisphaera giovannonii]QEH37706.1 Exodeoxyribonuclease 7 large subunit [Aquisphaera giovannonii]